MTSEQDRVSKWLNRARDIDDAVKALEEVRMRNKSLAERCTVSYGGVGTSGTHENSQEKIIHMICDNDTEIRNQLETLCSARQEIAKAIDSLEDSKLTTILRMRYLAYKKTYEIAEEIGVDIKTVSRRHKKALDEIIKNGY